MCQPSLKMQTAKQQFEPQRASWEKIIYSSVFAAGITLNHTQPLHLLGMLSVWDENKSNTVGSPHPFLQIAFFRNLEPRKREWYPHRYKCLICPWTTDWGRQARLNVRAWLVVVEGRTKVLSFFSFSFSESLNQYPTCNCTKGHRSREFNTDALKPFKLNTVQRQKYSWHWISCIRTIISNYLGWGLLE